MTFQDLINSCYKQFPVPTYSHKSADVALQKRFRNGVTTLYFINVYVYRNPRSGQDVFEADVELYPISMDDGSITLKLHRVGSIEWLESFVAKTYADMNCAPDIHNND